MVTIQKYVKAQSLEEAWKLNQGKKNRILGGMLWMRLGNGTISTAIDLCDLGLDTIEETDEEFSIGARERRKLRIWPSAQGIGRAAEAAGRRCCEKCSKGYCRCPV